MLDLILGLTLAAAPAQAATEYEFSITLNAASQTLRLPTLNACKAARQDTLELTKSMTVPGGAMEGWKVVVSECAPVRK